MPLASKIATETYTDRAALRYTKAEWLDAVHWCLKRGMGGGDTRNFMLIHAA